MKSFFFLTLAIALTGTSNLLAGPLDLPPGPRLGIAAALADLDVDDKRVILATLRDHREDIQHAVDTVIDAREQLFNQIHDESFDEPAIREASSAVAAAEADLAVLRAEILHEIRAEVGPEVSQQLESSRRDLMVAAKSKLTMVRSIISAAILQAPENQ